MARDPLSEDWYQWRYYKSSSLLHRAKFYSNFVARFVGYLAI